MNRKIKENIGLVIFGMFICFIFLEISMRLGGQALLFFQESKNKASLDAKDNIKILCLGESTTARGGEESWPSQLEYILNVRSINKKFKVFNKGIEGVESSVILSNLEQNIEKYQPNVVVVMMGVNDNPGTIKYEDNFKTGTLLFLKGFRVYKLIKTIWSNIENKIMTMRTMDLIYQVDAFEDVYFRNGEHGGFEEAEGILNKVLKKDPKNIDAYLLLAGCLMLQQRAEEAISLLNDALVKDPNNLRILNELGIAYKTHGKWNEAEKIFNEIIDKDPENYAVYVELGDCYIDQNRYKEAEIILKRGLKINPTYEPLYTALGLNYRKVKDDMGIEELSKMIIDNNVENDRLLGFVATSFTENNNYKEAKIYYEKANNQRLNYYNNATRHNYLELKEILKQRNIKLVCAQYPMRSVDALKKLFLRTEGMIFIDNEKLFKDALMENKYEDLFTDNFGGEFGHATAKGNKLLAENIANVIIEEVFK